MARPPRQGSDRAFKKQRLPLAKISEDQRRPALRRLVLSCHVPLRPPPVGLEFAPSVPPVPLPACLRASGHWAGSAGVASGLSRASGDRWIARGASPWIQAQSPFRWDHSNPIQSVRRPPPNLLPPDRRPPSVNGFASAVRTSTKTRLLISRALPFTIPNREAAAICRPWALVFRCLGKGRPPEMA